MVVLNDLPTNCRWKRNNIIGKHSFNSFKSNKKHQKEKNMINDQLIITVGSRTYHYPPKAGVIIFNKDKSKLLCVLNNYHPTKSKWGFPKGHLEKNETRSICAQRELKEETGVDLEIFENDPYIKINNSIYYIYCIDDNIFSNCVPIDKNEIRDIKFIDINKIKNFQINKELRIAISNKLSTCKLFAKEIN